MSISASNYNSLPTCYSAENLACLSKDQLIHLVLQYQTICHSSTTSISSAAAVGDDNGGVATGGNVAEFRVRAEPQKPKGKEYVIAHAKARFQCKSKRKDGVAFEQFDFRNVCLELCYLGDYFQGWAQQQGQIPSKNFLSQTAGQQPRTVEGSILSALHSAGLIESLDFKFHHLQVSGRTDSGVHAKQQFISVWIRSAYQLDNQQQQNNKRRKIGFVPAEYMQKMRINKQNENGTQTVNDNSDFFEMINSMPSTVSATSISAASSSASSSSSDACMYCDECDEIDYVRVINCHLPSDIRVLHWTPVPIHFSARFSCQFRAYRYVFFPDKCMDLSVMDEAAKYLRGVQCFANFCKKDKHDQQQINETEELKDRQHSQLPEDAKKDYSFYRLVDQSMIRKLDGKYGHYNDNDGNEHKEGQPYEFYCSANSFLTHQIRMTMNFLFQIALGKQSPNAIQKLLDSHSQSSPTSCGLSVQLAPANGLILDSCDFQPDRTVKTLKELTDKDIHQQQMPSWLINSLIAASADAVAPSTSVLASAPLSALQSSTLSPSLLPPFPFFSAPSSSSSSSSSFVPPSSCHKCLPRWSANYHRLCEHFESQLLEQRMRLCVFGVLVEELQHRKKNIKAHIDANTHKYC